MINADTQVGECRKCSIKTNCFAIVFKSVSDDGKIWDYSLRFNQSEIADTFTDNEYRIVDRVTKDGEALMSQSRDRYWGSGFLNVQGMLDTAITEYIAVDINEYPYIF